MNRDRRGYGKRVDPQPYAEVLGEDGEEPLIDRLWQALLRRPLALPLLVVLGLVVAGAGAALLTAHGTRVATVTVTASGSSAPVSAPWQASTRTPGWPPSGANGRPAGPVVLSVAVTARRGSSGASTSVVAITGPGVVGSDNPEVLLPVGESITVPLKAELDCALVPEVIPSGAYGLRIHAHSGWGSKDGLAEAGAVAQKWSAAIQVACASWLARRDLTVTALTAKVSPTDSRFVLELTVTNSGARAATLSSAAEGGISGRLWGAPIRVPAYGEATGTFIVALDTCDSVPEPGNQTSPLTSEPSLSSQFNLVGLAGQVPPDSPQSETPGFGDGYGGHGDGFGATGILLTADADQALTGALAKACGGLGPMLPLISPDTVRYDRARRVLIVPVLVDVTPGRVRSLRLQTEPLRTPTPAGDAADMAFRPLWSTTDDLVPDPSGQVKVTLRYRIPETGPCPMRGGFLPNLVATLKVPDSGVERTVRYEGGLDLGQDPQAIPLLCSQADQQ
jgi:hypothetical protein